MCVCVCECRCRLLLLASPICVYAMHIFRTNKLTLDAHNIQICTYEYVCVVSAIIVRVSVPNQHRIIIMFALSLCIWPKAHVCCKTVWLCWLALLSRCQLPLAVLFVCLWDGGLPRKWGQEKRNHSDSNECIKRRRKKKQKVIKLHGELRPSTERPVLHVVVCLSDNLPWSRRRSTGYALIRNCMYMYRMRKCYGIISRIHEFRQTYFRTSSWALVIPTAISFRIYYFRLTRMCEPVRISVAHMTARAEKNPS